MSDHPDARCIRAGSSDHNGVHRRANPLNVSVFYTTKEFEMKKVFTLALAIVLSVAAISSIGCGGSETAATKVTTTKK